MTKSTTVTKGKPRSKVDWEKLRGCLLKWKEETYEKIASLRHIAVGLHKEVVTTAKSPVSDLMNKEDLLDLIDSFDDVLCRLDNTIIYPLVTEIIHNPLDCLKR
jgi:hypothetical protein